ncbi:MAG: 3D domain-containing protein [Phycisphaerales bacterium]|nr:MAG: 3D domain-containing protein [Phycisphaerales bacterium]
MKRQIIRRSGRTVISWIGLMAIVCVPSFIAGAAHTEIDASSAKWQTLRMRVTAYCPCSKCCGQYADGITASGHEIQPGDTFVAADKRYSLGTEMVIPGYSNSQTVKVLDRGGAIKGNRLDVFFHTHQEALEWGVQYLDVQIRDQ